MFCKGIQKVKLSDKGVGNKRNLLLTKGQLMQDKIMKHPLPCVSLSSAIYSRDEAAWGEKKGVQTKPFSCGIAAERSCYYVQRKLCERGCPAG